MKWSLKLGSVAGIGIYVHWTFFLLVAWILYSHLSHGEGWRAALEGVVFVLSVFACIVLHELGHALTALRFGVSTRDITLLPIGGVARLQRIPEDPIQEFLVAIAGPAVNVVIAAVLFGVIVMMTGLSSLQSIPSGGSDFLTRLMLVNLGLVIFNAIPAFPMDGGRVLRAALSPLMGRLRATDTAAAVGQFIAIVFGVLGLFGNGMLIFIALFIYLGAQQEAQMAHVRALLDGIPVRSAMSTRFRVFTPTDVLDDHVSDLLEGRQKDFPVVDGSRVVGMVRGRTLAEHVAQADFPAAVADVMQRDCRAVEDTAMLQDAFEQMQSEDCSAVPVMQKGRLVGILSLENIGQWLLLQSERHAKGFRENGRVV